MTLRVFTADQLRWLLLPPQPVVGHVGMLAQCGYFANERYKIDFEFRRTLSANSDDDLPPVTIAQTSNDPEVFRAVVTGPRRASSVVSGEWPINKENSYYSPPDTGITAPET